MLRWKKKHGVGKFAKDKNLKKAEAKEGAKSADGGMPAGLTKMQQLRWKKEHGGGAKKTGLTPKQKLQRKREQKAKAATS